MPSAPSDKRDIQSVTLTFRNETRALYDDGKGKKLDIALIADPLARDTVAFLRSLVDSRDDTDSGELLRLLGRHMFEFVFGPGVPRGGSANIAADDPLKARNRLVDRLQWARDDVNRLLHLRLDFEDDAQELALWPWEFLYYPTGDSGWKGYFVAERRVVVVREMHTQDPVASAPPPVNVLLAISEPASERADVGGDEMEQILQAHEPKRVQLHTRRNLRFNELRDEIGRLKPEIFHFHGHGSDDGGVYLPRRPQAQQQRTIEMGFSAEPPPEEGVRTGGETVAALFAEHRPQVVVFTACRTAFHEVAFTDVAQQLANERIPVVVAMQFKVSVEAAQMFAETFYAQLLNEREWIEAAFAAGLARLAGSSAETSGHLAARSVGTPVLFVNRAGGRLLVPAPDEQGGAPVVPVTADRRCVFCGAVGVVKFCGECGAPAFCPDCDTQYLKRVKFCTSCQTPVPMPRGADLRAQSASSPPPGDIGIEETPT